MKKIIIKSSFFIVPFFLFSLITFLFYSDTPSPDLLRLGYIPNYYKNYRSVFDKEFSRKIYYYSFSEVKFKKTKILTIGDSFSEQGNFGYKNYLAEKYSVLHIDRTISGNQIATLYKMINGDFFKKYTVKYVILENVERYFLKNSKQIDVTKKTTVAELDALISKHNSKKEKGGENPENVGFFSKTTVYFPFSMLRYHFNQNYLSNKMVYNVTLKSNKLFSNRSNRLLFIEEDLSCLKQNNDLIEIHKLNAVLNDLANKLSKKKVKLIILPAPDKYDLYYDYISNKTNFSKPLFFEHLNSLKKDYIYINSKSILSSQLKMKKDIYFYDDTHWSPTASKIISHQIIKAIEDKKNL